MNYKRIYIAQNVLALSLSSVLCFYGLNNVFSLIREIDELETLAQNTIQFSEELASLKKENEQLRKSIPKVSPENAVLNVLSFSQLESQHLKIHKLSNTKVFPGEELDIIEFGLTIKGEFKAFLLWLNEFEKRPDLGHIVHMDLKSEQVSKNQRDLFSHVIINVLSQK